MAHRVVPGIAIIATVEAGESMEYMPFLVSVPSYLSLRGKRAVFTLEWALVRVYDSMQPQCRQISEVQGTVLAFPGSVVGLGVSDGVDRGDVLMILHVTLN